MGVASFVDPERKVVLTVFSGVVSIDDVKSSCASIKANPEFRPDFHQLIDLSNASKLDLHYDELNILAEVHDPFSDKGRRACIGPNSVSFGIGRMYQMILNNPAFRVFRSEREAINWLGLDGFTLKAAQGGGGTK